MCAHFGGVSPLPLQRGVCVCSEGGKGRRWPCQAECPCLFIFIYRLGAGCLCRNQCFLFGPGGEGLNAALEQGCVCR